MDSTLLYPTYEDIYKHEEVDIPCLYNFACLSGCQLYLDVSRGYYSVYSVGWLPSFEDRSKFIEYEVRHSLFKSKEFRLAKHYFCRCLTDLVHRHNCLQLELFPGE